MKDWLLKNKTKVLVVAVALLTGYWLGRGRSPEIGFRSPATLISPASPTSLTSPTAFIEKSNFAVEESAAPASSPSERLVIKIGSLSLLVKNVRESVETVQKLATDLGGFVVDSRITVIDEKKENLRATVTVRVPAEKFDLTLKTLKDSALKVESEQTSGQDVTEEYTDLQSRLRNLEATENQLLKIMERAGEIKDVLAVQTELTRVREQIETTKGRIKFLEESAKMSAVTANFATEAEELPLVEEGWRPLATAKAALRSLISFSQTVVDKLIYVLVFFSPIVIVILLVWLAKKIKK